jgi:hypothetical protein
MGAHGDRGRVCTLVRLMSAIVGWAKTMTANSAANVFMFRDVDLEMKETGRLLYVLAWPVRQVR